MRPYMNIDALLLQRRDIRPEGEAPSVLGRRLVRGANIDPFDSLRGVWVDSLSTRLSCPSRSVWLKIAEQLTRFQVVEELLGGGGLLQVSYKTRTDFQFCGL